MNEEPQFTVWAEQLDKKLVGYPAVSWEAAMALAAELRRTRCIVEIVPLYRPPPPEQDAKV
jgi:hypothetical protein